ncbi:MAG: alpha,alpha-trehalase TreF [Hyphomonas sp.]|nr:alpha,alpha-trehalase TreF [Hyphomonas sp.]
MACLALAACVTAPAPESGPAPPSLRYPDLFQSVALSGAVDPKDWVDADPLAADAEILAAYAAGNPQTKDELDAFVRRWFRMPGAAGAVDLPAGLTLSEHIEALWPHLTRSADLGTAQGSLLPLPHDYLVPGGRFREVYYWDSYFTLLGLGPEHAELKRNIIDNFAALISDTGHIPNANRTYYLSRSQPPFFFLMVSLLSPDDPPAAWAEYLPELIAEHAYWTTGEHAVDLPGGHRLSRYWDARTVPRDESYVQDHATASDSTRPDEDLYRDLRAGAESGWDFSSRWLTDPDDLSTIRTTRIVPVDLNALLYGLERAIAEGCLRAGEAGCAMDYARLAGERRTAMYAVLQGHSDLLMDYDLDTGETTGRVSAASLYPLFLGVATDAQAFIAADMVDDELLAPGGLLTTPLDTGQQWDAPNGWAPLHWIAVEGLRRYGEDGLAHEIARRWLATVARTYCETGKLVEKYNVTTPRPGGGGEYPTQDGFGWTNGVTAALLAEYPDLSEYGNVRPADAPEACAQIN